MLALLFVVVPIVELILLIQLGQAVGLLPTLALVLLTGVGGALLARSEGLRALFRFQRELASGEMPDQAIQDGICVLIGGAFLLTPGVLTDAVGFALLVPWSRRWIQRRVRARLARMAAEGSLTVVTMRSGFPGGPGASWPVGGPLGPLDDALGSDADSGPKPKLDRSKEIVIE